MPTQRQMIADMNYYNDRRVRAAEEAKWYVSFNADREVALVDLGPCPDCDRDETPPSDSGPSDLEEALQPLRVGKPAVWLTARGRRVHCTVEALGEDAAGPYADIRMPDFPSAPGERRRVSTDDLQGMPKVVLSPSDVDTIERLDRVNALAILTEYKIEDIAGLDEENARSAVQTCIENGDIPATALDLYACTTCRKRVQFVKVHTQYEVCSLCSGRGKHVNPSIDAGGISSDDEFWEDDHDYDYDGEDEAGASRYMRGDYDVPCYSCGGRRVVPVPADNTPTDVLKAIHQRAEDEAEYAAERAAERRYGC